MLKRIICIFLLIFLGFGFSLNASAADRYQWITSTDKMTLSYDTQSVQYDSYSKTVDVWIVWQYTEAGAKDYIEDMRASGVCQESKWDKFSHSKERWLLSKNQFKIIGAVDYDVDGKVLYSSTDKYAKWNDIAPDTFAEAVRDQFILFIKS